MIYKDPATGKEYKNIEDAVAHYCAWTHCKDCVFKMFAKGLDCVSWPREHPREAAKMIGYEVIEDGQEQED